MAEEIELQKIKEEYPEFFNKVAPELIDFISSEKTLAQINDICAQNGLGGEQIEQVAYRVTLALLGRLPKENLVIALEKGVGLARETAEKISSEIDRLVFSAAPESQPTKQQPTPVSQSEQKITEPEVKPEEPEGPPKKPDTYREQI